VFAVRLIQAISADGTTQNQKKHAQHVFKSNIFKKSGLAKTCKKIIYKVLQ